MWLLLTLLLVFVLVQIWAYRSSSASAAGDTNPIATETRDGHDTDVDEAPHTRARTGRYLASCPTCGERLTRRDFFTFQRQIRRRCRKCQTPLRSNYKLDLLWSLGLVSPFGVCFLLALFGIVSWVAPVAALLLFFAAGYVLFPYNTKLEIADESEMPNTSIRSANQGLHWTRR
jgi:Ca2+/Na+ antiporter